ncbi:MAG TPA: HEAT repeat domain-containing protein [Planctomycetota bacterium]|nr:HEAT repeat domain-containing protein [Planctomycetota bacterium]
MPFPTLGALLIPFLVLLPQEFQDRSDLLDLVRRLGSESAQERDLARRKLKEAGRAAAPALEAAIQDSDPEVASRARELLRVLELSEKLSPSLRAALPGVEDRLASGSDSSWTREFLEALERDPKTGAKLHPSLKRADLEVLVVPAFRGAENPQDFINLCSRLGYQPWPTVVPALVERLGDSRVAKFAVMGLPFTPYPSTVEALLPVLKDGPPEARARAAEVLGALHLPESGPPLVQLLEDPDPNVKREAIINLGTLRYRPAGEALRRFLGQPAFELDAIDALGRIAYKEAIGDISPFLGRSMIHRTRAVRALGALGCREAAPEIEKLLIKEPDREEQFQVAAAVGALGQLGYTEALPKVRQYVQDLYNIQLRMSAILALGALGDRASARLLVSVLDDQDPRVSLSARSVLWKLQATEVVPEIIAHLKVQPAEAYRGEAAATLGDLGARESIPAVLPLLQTKFPWKRAAVAEILTELGSEDGIDILFEEPGGLHRRISLNALRRPELFRRLVREQLRVEPEGRPLELARAVAGQLGRSLVFSKKVLEENIPESPLPYLQVDGNLPPWRLLDILIYAAGILGGEFILEDEELRLVSAAEGLAFWKAWRADQKKH